MRIVIPGQVPAQKNGKQIIPGGPNRRPMLISNPIVKKWQKETADWLALNYKGNAEGKVCIAYQFFVKDERRRDIDNMIASVNDALVKAGLIKDDSWQYLSIGGADAQLDKNNPRVELFITEE